jgi:hypothetical protein
MRVPYNTKPDLRPTEFKDGSGWYVLVVWGDRPPEQVGGFIDEDGAKHWINAGSQAWLTAQLEDWADGF